MSRWRLLYPLLFAVAPVLHLGAHNADQIDPAQVSSAGAVALAGAAALFGLFLLLRRDADRAALCTAIAVVGFFSYGNFFVWLLRRRITGDEAVVHLLAGLVFLGGAALLWRWVWRTRRSLAGLGSFFTVASAIVVATSLVSLARSGKLGTSDDPYASWVVPAPAQPGTPPSAERPDIYYIILDGYARADVLRELYSYDNTPFLAALAERGFWVGARSWSNYPTTFLSLASSLNLRYLDEDRARLHRELGPRTKERGPFEAQIRDPLVARILRAHGYTYATVLTSWSGTERSRAADVAWAYSPILGREFYGVLMDSTPLRVASPRVADLHHFTLEKIPAAADLPGPTFAFFHLLMPHNPYVFDHRGREIAQIPATLQFKMKTGGWRDKPAYVEQLRYVNQRILAVVDDLLARPGPRPIIILQADHGSASTAYYPVRREMPLPSERLAILNAILVPEPVRARLVDTITPVNTLRLILAELFGEPLPPLPDRSFYSWYRRPYEWREVTAELERGDAEP